jgi:hypothetical protein
MSALTRNWLIGSTVAWSLLIYGWVGDSKWAIGAAVVIFLALMIERYDNWKRAH